MRSPDSPGPARRRVLTTATNSNRRSRRRRTRAGRSTSRSEFVVRIDPANEGVKLRRRVNRQRANVQRANVYVDGQLIPDAPWYVCDIPVPAETAFRDSDYEIPVKYTKGKSSIAVRLEHVERAARPQQQRILLLGLLLPEAVSVRRGLSPSGQR